MYSARRIQLLTPLSENDDDDCLIKGTFAATVIAPDPQPS